MKKNQITYIKSHFVVGIMAILLLLSSCIPDDLNEDLDRANSDDMDKDYLKIGSLFPQMQMNIYPLGDNRSPNAYQIMQNLMGDDYAGYFGQIGLWNNSQNGVNYFLLDIWNLVPFQETYTKVMPAWIKLKRYTVDSENPNPTAFALGEILKVEALHRLTDIYGPIPYSDFGKSSKPKYDAQDVVYQNFFTDLNAAIDELTRFVDAYGENTRPLKNYDMIYGGNYLKWIKFANSLKLRLAMRMVYADPVNAQKYAEEAVAHKYGVMTTNADNALLASGPAGVVINPMKQIWADYQDCVMSANMESFLTGYADPRLPVYFNTAKRTAIGARNYFGVRNGITLNATYRNYYTLFSTPNINEDTPMPWMLASEIYFLRAEGAIRSWNMGDTPENLYNQGITMSFEQRGVAAAAPAYINNSTAKPAAYADPHQSSNNIPLGDAKLSTVTIKWEENPTGGFERKLERIITQKWLAMYPDGQEAWSEFRRTGYPKVFEVRINNSPTNAPISTTVQIRRISYPLSEYRTNADNVADGVLKLGGIDGGGTKLWWDKK